MPFDILDFIKERKGGIAIKSLDWWPPLRFRALALAATLKGYFSFSEFCKMFLPVIPSKNKPKLINRYIAYLHKELEREFNLFGRKFEPINCYEAIELVNQIVIFDQYQAKHFLKKEKPVVIDAGAHIGIFSIFAAHLAPESRIFSFEPVAKTFQILRKNTQYYPQISCFNAGLGDKISQKNISVNPKYACGGAFEDSSCYKREFSRREGEKLELADIFTIDSFVETHGLSRIDFIKIDTEGYEAKILKGASKTIEKWKPVIAMSAYHNPEDRKILPQIVKKIYPAYVCELYKDSEAVFLCHV